MSTTNIEWTDRVWNPVTGCTKVSAGCKFCYAETIANRRLPHGGFTDRPFTTVRTHDDRLAQPLSWRKPQRVFVNSMSDLFHENVPDDFILRVLNVIRAGHANGHTFQVLTKRPERMRSMMSQLQFDNRGAGRMFLEERGLTRQGTPISFAPVMRHLWLGVSVENQETANERIPVLLQTPAAVRFISAEPLLGPIDILQFLTAGDSANPIGALNTHGQTGSEANSADTLGPANMEAVAKHVGAIRQEADRPAVRRLDWVIVGGESGPGARPCHVEWIRSIVEQCHGAGVPPFVKQVGSDPRGACEWEHHDEWPPRMLDEHGVLSSVSGEAGTLCHAVDDAWWPCRLKLTNRKGGDMSEWPGEDLRVREFPRGQVPA